MPRVEPIFVEALTIKKSTKLDWRVWVWCLSGIGSFETEEVP
jgi:hypothetical protein